MGKERETQGRRGGTDQGGRRHGEGVRGGGNGRGDV